MKATISKLSLRYYIAVVLLNTLLRCVCEETRWQFCLYICRRCTIQGCFLLILRWSQCEIPRKMLYTSHSAGVTMIEFHVKASRKLVLYCFPEVCRYCLNFSSSLSATFQNRPRRPEQYKTGTSVTTITNWMWKRCTLLEF